MKQEIVEFYGRRVQSNWQTAAMRQYCPFLDKKCKKTRKGRPDLSFGTCAIQHGDRAIIDCPFRFLERNQIFVDALHLLNHDPGNELHVVPEITIPGGHVDYFLVSTNGRRPVDFVGIEIQALDTTGNVWAARQRLLKQHRVPATLLKRDDEKPFGINWKMTAKTTLTQLNHKIQSFEHLSKHFVLTIQDTFFEYLRNEFALEKLQQPRVGDAMHFHVYQFALDTHSPSLTMRLTERWSTDASGLAYALGLKADPRIELQALLDGIKRKISDATLWVPHRH